MKIGAHESIQGGFHMAIDRAADDRCESLQIFTKAPGIWRGKPIEEADASLFRTRLAASELSHVLVHDAYLINPCAAKPALRDKSWRALEDEAIRCDIIGADYLVMHPGSAAEVEDGEALRLIAAAIDQALGATQRVSILIENTAGQGSSVGHHFEQLAAIIEMIEHKERIGICLDTCHAFAAGYDLGTPESADTVFDELDRTAGKGTLRALHLNDSKKPLGSRVDRHARIGQGEIGIELFRWLVNAPRFARLPAVLETPVEKGETYKGEVAVLMNLREPPK